jgi:hypothetical protein
MLAKARRRAAAAIAQIATGVDPEDAKSIRALQAHIRLYDALLEDVREIIARGQDAEHELSAQDRNDVLSDVVSGLPGETADAFVDNLSAPIALPRDPQPGDHYDA